MIVLHNVVLVVAFHIGKKQVFCILFAEASERGEHFLLFHVQGFDFFFLDFQLFDFFGVFVLDSFAIGNLFVDNILLADKALLELLETLSAFRFLFLGLVHDL